MMVRRLLKDEYGKTFDENISEATLLVEAVASTRRCSLEEACVSLEGRTLDASNEETLQVLSCEEEPEGIDTTDAQDVEKWKEKEKKKTDAGHGPHQ